MLEVIMHPYHPSDDRKHKIKSWSRPAWKKENLSPKQPQQTRLEAWLKW
jgi:hypothetical protein